MKPLVVNWSNMPDKRYTFRVKDSNLYLVYSSPEGVSWVFGNLALSSSTSLRGKVFTVTDGEIIHESEELGGEAEFLIGTTEGEYFKIEPLILSTQQPIFIHKSVISQLEPEDFYVRQPYFEMTAGNNSIGGDPKEKYIPIVPILEKMFEGQISIGGEDESSIPVDIFKKAASILPDRKEVRRYLDARIAHILGEYVVPKRNFEADRDRLISTREATLVTDGNQDLSLFEKTKDFKREIFQFAYEELNEMLLAEGQAYSEADWQEKIINIILLLYPKYVHVEKSVRIKKDGGYGFVDLMLFDAGGFVDLIEVKKPIVNDVDILRKSQYRDNYVPSRELSGAIMQIEKYSFWLSRWGKKGENDLQTKFNQKLPEGMQVRIANPVGIIIFGRDKDFNAEQKQDLEIIKRKHKHIVDILTYDDLLRRLKNILIMLNRD